MLRTNRSSLLTSCVTGEITPPVFGASLYSVNWDGSLAIVPGMGGICLNVRVGDPAFGYASDHLEPAVSARSGDDRANRGFTLLACIGNRATVISGDAKDATGTVTGKHGGVDHVLIDFAPAEMERMAIGDRIRVWGRGVGLELLDAPDVRVFNLDPDMLEAWGVTVEDGTVAVPVTRIVPAAVMGSGLGRDTVARGDYDIQTFDEAMSERYGLREIRLGDIVAIADADHSFGRVYRTGAISVGIVSHGASGIAGHGPGVTTLLTSPLGRVRPIIDRDTNIATMLQLR